MDAHLQQHDYLVGNGMTLADIALFAYTRSAWKAQLETEHLTGLTRWLKDCQTAFASTITIIDQADAQAAYVSD